MVNTAICRCLAAILLVGLATSPADARPRVALALSGGGAAGAAHVGVIRALEEAGLRPDCVAGTSMGAVVGGLYAAGLTPDELADAVEKTDWLSILDDAPERAAEHPMRRESRTGVDTIFARVPFGVRDGELRADAGLVDGNRLLLQLRDLARRADDVRDFDKLPTPFRAVATDLATGAPVVLGDGDLALALRASMAIPGLFPAINWRGQFLADGGVANNLPIDVARELCGDLVIAVSIPPSDPDPAELSTFTGAIAQTMSLFIARSSREQLDRHKGVYRLITPPVEDIGMLDFADAREAMRRGYEAARPVAAALARSLAAEGVAPLSLAPRVSVDDGGDDPMLTVAALRIENTSFYDDDVIRARLELTPPTTIAMSELRRRLQRIYALEGFDLVTYRVDPGDVLVVTTQGRASGPIEFRLGAAFQDSFDGRARYVFGGGVGFTGLNPYGLRVDIDALIGSAQAARLQIEQPLDAGQEWFLTGLAAYGASPEPFSPTPGQRIAEYQLKRAAFGADLSYAPVDQLKFSLGGRYLWSRAELLTGDPTVNVTHIQQERVGPQIGVELDTLDDVWVPREGVAVGATLFQDVFASAEGQWRGQLEVDAIGAVDLGGVSAQAFLRGAAGVGDTDGEIGLNPIGGFQRLSGFEHDAFIGTVSGVSGLRGVVDAPAFERWVGLEGFWGGSLEYGGAWADWDSVGPENGYLAGAAFVGLRTGLGPLFLGYGAAEGGHDSIYLGFGERF